MAYKLNPHVSLKKIRWMKPIFFVSKLCVFSLPHLHPGVELREGVNPGSPGTLRRCEISKPQTLGWPPASSYSPGTSDPKLFPEGVESAFKRIRISATSAFKFFELVNPSLSLWIHHLFFFFPDLESRRSRPSLKTSIGGSIAKIAESEDPTICSREFFHPNSMRSLFGW